MRRLNLCAYLYLALLTLLTVLSAHVLLSRPAFETNITALLPQIYRDDALESILKHQSSAFASRIVVIARSAQEADAERAASQVAREMRSSGLFSVVEDTVSRARLDSLTEQLLRHPFQLVEPPISEGDPEAVSTVLKASLTRAFSPESLEFLRHIDEDPLLLLPAYLDHSIDLGSRFSLQNGFVHADTEGLSNVVVTATLNESGLASPHMGSVTRFFESLPSYEPAQILPAGIAFFAEQSASSMKREVTRISSVTLVALIAFLLWVFRSPWVVALIVSCVTTSFLAALYLSQNIWWAVCGGSLHLLTIGFGSSLLGISPDYAIHYFVTHRSTAAGATIAPERKIRPALLLGYCAAIIGFLGIALSPFPGLQQLALFSYVGLTAALLTTLLLLPQVSGPPRVDQRIVTLAHAISGPLWRRLRKVTLGCALILMCVGLPRLSVIDDIRALHAAPRFLVDRQREAAKILGFSEGSTLVVVQGKDPEQVLQREEALKPLLGSLVDSGKLLSYRAVSRVVPSQATQQRTYDRYSKMLASHRAEVNRFAAEVALPKKGVAVLWAVEGGAAPPPLLLTECLKTSACDSVRDLWIGEVSAHYASVIPLVGFNGNVREIFAGLPGVTALNQADSISDALKRYRLSATRYTALLYALIFLILTARYGIQHSWRLCLPPLTGGLTALAALGVCGVPINVFSVFALLVLVGLSIDYAIFNAEDDPQHAFGSLAVLFSAVTTTISFGFLALSSMPALMSFGIVLSIGVILAAIVAPVCQSTGTKLVSPKSSLLALVLVAAVSCCSGCSLSIPAPTIRIGKLPPSVSFQDLCPKTGMHAPIAFSHGSSETIVWECRASEGVLVVLNSFGVRTRTITLFTNGELRDEVTYLGDSGFDAAALLGQVREKIGR